MNTDQRLDRAIETPLRRWRLVHGLTQEQAGQRFDIPDRVYARYELGLRPPHAKHLAALRKKTNLSYDALFYPAEFLAAHPEFLAEGAQPLQEGPGRPRKQAVGA
jgi:transcriptional regulator with XRE-family HTH domain